MKSYNVQQKRVPEKMAWWYLDTCRRFGTAPTLALD